MKKHCLRILIAVLGVAGLGAATKAQSLDKITVNVPYEFVVAGQTLPAGNYIVDRGADDNLNTLILSSFENHVNTFFVANQAESIPDGKAEVVFEQIDGQHFVSQIKTAEHVFTIPVTRSQIMEATAKSHGGSSAMGSSAGSK